MNPTGAQLEQIPMSAQRNQPQTRLTLRDTMTILECRGRTLDQPAHAVARGTARESVQVLRDQVRIILLAQADPVAGDLSGPFSRDA